MANGALIIVAGFFIFSVAATRVVRALGIARWEMALCLIVVAFALYLTNVVLLRKYIRKRAPHYDNERDWDLTAGLGVVPRWVSVLGLLSISALIAGSIPLIIAFVRR